MLVEAWFWVAIANAVWFWIAWSGGVALLEPSTTDVLRFGANHGPSVASGEWWRLVSSSWVHAGVAHLALNLAALWLVGSRFERKIGAWRWLTLHVAAGFVAACASLARAPSAVSCGASGAIFGSIGAYLAHLILRRTAYEPSDRVRTISVLVGVVILNVIAGAIVPDVDQAAHVGGFVTGVVAGWAMKLTRSPTAETTTASPEPGSRDRRRALAVPALILFALTAALWRVTDDARSAAETAYLRAQDAAESGAWARVHELTSLAIEREGGDPAYHALRAEAARHENRPDDALRDLDRAIELDPEDARTRIERARLRFARLEEAGALVDLERAAELAPDDLEVSGLRAHVLYSLREFERAARDFETSAIDDPARFADARLYRALCHLHLGAPSALAALRVDAADARCGIDEPWLELAARFLVDDITQADFLERMSTTKSRAGLDLIVRAWWLIGEHALATRSDSAARRAFEEATSRLSVHTLDRSDYLHSARWRVHLLGGESKR